MDINFYSVLVSGFVTLLAGFVWYHPKVFGTVWMREANLPKKNFQKQTC